MLQADKFYDELLLQAGALLQATWRGGRRDLQEVVADSKLRRNGKALHTLAGGDIFKNAGNLEGSFLPLDKSVMVGGRLGS